MTCPYLETTGKDYTALCYKIRRDRERGVNHRLPRLLTELASLEEAQEQHKRRCETCSGSHDEAEKMDLVAARIGETKPSR